MDAWNDGPARAAIDDFVAAVDAAGIAPEDRVAVFDNDGTLWPERPLPIQLAFTLERLATLAHADPALRDQQPFKAAIERDTAWLGNVVERHYAGDDRQVKVLLGGILKAFAGMAVDDYVGRAGAFVRGHEHPTLGRPYAALAYLPMVQLLRHLEAHGFATFIASGGDRDFMRAIADELYGIPPERVIGSSNALRWTNDAGGGALTYAAEPDVFDDGRVKPVRIWSRTGRRPLAAAGNSNGDVPMLLWAGGTAPALRLLVHHDDAERDVASDRGAEQALDHARREGWTVVSVRADWRVVFGP